MTAKVPSKLHRYDIGHQIGAGSMGVVHAGYDVLICRPVAIKLIRTDLVDEGERDTHRARLRHEVRSAGRCIHPGIVTIFDYVERDEDRYIVMELVEGTVLQTLLADGPLTIGQGVDITLQLLDALAHAHRQGVVHRDIKPSNIIVGAGSRIKITDFGIARLSLGDMTHAGTLVGTPSYMAPEQARGEAVDHRADLYSVGMVFLRILTGAQPYGDGGFLTILKRVSAEEPVDVSPLQSISPELAAIAVMALAKDAADRFQSAEEFANLLRAVTSTWPVPEIWPGMGEDASAPPAPVPLLSNPQFPRLDEVVEPTSFLEFGDRDRRGSPTLPPLDPPAAPVSLGVGDPGGSAVAHLDAGGTADTHDERSPLPDELLGPTGALLAKYLGPVSGILVRRLSTHGVSWEALSQGLVDRIDSPSDRARFQSEFAALVVSLRL